MFSAMILACAFGTNGTADLTQCTAFVPPQLWESEELCMASLQFGIATVDQKGWAVVDYQCFDWKTKKGKSL